MIALKPYAIPLPRDTDPELRRTMQRLEETLRSNNATIEDALNALQTAVGSATGSGDLTVTLNDGILHIS